MSGKRSRFVGSIQLLTVRRLRTSAYLSVDKLPLVLCHVNLPTLAAYFKVSKGGTPARAALQSNKHNYVHIIMYISSLLPYLVGWKHTTGEGNQECCVSLSNCIIGENNTLTSATNCSFRRFPKSLSCLIIHWKDRTQ